MKYAVEIGSGAMIYIYIKFHEDWFRQSEVTMGGFKDKQTAMVIT
jgi:hypothetical protein